MNELLHTMLSHADPAQVPGLARFFKTGPGQYGEGDVFLGIKVPVTREVVKACWRNVSPEQMEECMASEYHEVRLAALLTLVAIFSHPAKWNAAGNCTSVQQYCIDFYLSHTERINNWDLVDLSCYPLLGQWLLPKKDRSLLYHLARDGRTLWEQRMGAISDMLLHHPHDLIHKAVGWLLREAGKRDPEALKTFLTPRIPTMPRIMLRYAIEKFPPEERAKYLKM